MNIRTRQDLAEYVNYGNQVAYLFFWGHQKPTKGVTKTCFSQWYEAPFEIAGDHFMTAEHYMMYSKALLFGDQSAAKKLLKATNPGEAKKIGREVQGFDQQVWEANRFEIVVTGNVAKFNSDPELKAFLLGTGDRILVEASPVDRIWGIGLAQDHPDCSNPNNWKGDNLLGFALMEVRERFR
ncbi:MAG: NADAR family protein [Cytophagales bacterium]|nr:NADAR family protein [Cytophagales bacterium]